MEKAKIMDEKAIQRAVTRISHEIIEKNKNPLALYIFSNDTHFQNELVNLIHKMDERIKTLENR